MFNDINVSLHTTPFDQHFPAVTPSDIYKLNNSFYLRGKGGNDDSPLCSRHNRIYIFKNGSFGWRETRFLYSGRVHSKKEDLAIFENPILLEFFVSRHPFLVFYPHVAGIDDVSIGRFDNNTGRFRNRMRQTKKTHLKMRS